MRTPTRRKLFFFPAFVLLALLITYIVYWLWNHVLAVVVPVRTVTYWQAMGLLVLSKILLGGFRFGPPGGFSPPGGPFWRDRWRQMSDEEREKFKNEWRQRRSRWS